MHLSVRFGRNFRTGTKSNRPSGPVPRACAPSLPRMGSPRQPSGSGPSGQGGPAGLRRKSLTARCVIPQPSPTPRGSPPWRSGWGCWRPRNFRASQGGGPRLGGVLARARVPRLDAVALELDVTLYQAPPPQLPHTLVLALPLGQGAEPGASRRHQPGRCPNLPGERLEG